MKKIYQLRRDHALTEFNRIFAESVQIQPPAGGMALWVKFQKPFTQDQLMKLKELNIDTEQKFKQGSLLTIVFVLALLLYQKRKSLL